MASSQSITSANEPNPLLKSIRRKSAEKRKPGSPSDSLQESSEELFMPDFVSKVPVFITFLCIENNTVY